MSLKPLIHRSLDLLLEPQMLWPLLSWPRFSLTSFRMVSALNAQGVEPKTVIDVGANVGQFTVAASRVFNPVAVHCFEPAPACEMQLRRNTAGLGGVTVHPVALGECPGEATLHVNAHRQSSSLLPLAEMHKTAFPGARVVAALRVPVSTLDSEIAGLSLPHPILLKIDVQGAEAAVIRGAAVTLKEVDYLVVETSFAPMFEGEATFAQILQLANRHGFEFDRPVGWLTHPQTNEVLQIDALFRHMHS